VLNRPCDFHFKSAIGGFFEFCVDNARRLLPTGVQPLELHHGRALLAVLAFDFESGEVGPYHEVILAVMVAPFIDRGSPLPHSALFPFVVGTSTQAARDHGSANYYLPHYGKDVSVRFVRDGGVLQATVLCGAPVLELSVERPKGIAPEGVERLYQVISARGSEVYAADVIITGDNIEHEEETAALTLHPHEFNAPLEISEVNPWACREQWTVDGRERFWPVKRTGGC
jgi:hypothetical protein